MKSVKYLLVSLLFLFYIKGFSCWYPTYSPGEYTMFYADNTTFQWTVSLDEINIKEWRKLIKNQATIDDIKEVVYEYSIRDMEKIATGKLNKEDALYKNSFVRYLQKNNDMEIINFLILAKRCEVARANRADKWWYPTKEDLNNYDLQAILDEALAYKGTRLKNRYLLQAIRATYTMRNYDLCLNLWENQIKKMPQSAVKSMCMGYIGGIEFRKGNYEKAIQFYNESNDQDSFWWCAKHLTKENSTVERIKILYKYQPSSAELAFMIEKVCRDAEGSANYYLKKRARYIELRDFALRVAAEKRSDNPAMWQYAAAFLTFLDGKATLALQYSEKADRLQGTPFIKEKNKIFQIMLEAYVAKKYDADFEARFLPKLQWLDSLIVRGATKDFAYSDWDTKNNYSQYYPFDMMRKITLAVMVPKYQKQKDYTKALLLAGMASERMRLLVNFKHIETRTGWGDKKYKWNTDYSTDIFNYMNEFPVENVIEYQQLLQSGGRNEFEQFLIARCYKNDDYFNELIGTKYMRLEKFDVAIPYLSEVSNQYIKTMNIYSYFCLDPFREVYERKKLHKPYPAYKLNFAKKMLVLQQKMQTEKNKEKKAIATWQYAIALERSVSQRESWALTTYYMGDGYDNYNNTFNDWEKSLLKRSEHLIAQTGETIRNSEDSIIRAKYDWYKDVRYTWPYSYCCKTGKYLYQPNETYMNFSEKHKDITLLQPYLSGCDAFASYVLPQYIDERWGYNKNPK